MFINKKNKRKGFTLIEMMITAIIAGILAGGVTMAAGRITAMFDRYSHIITVHDLVSIEEGIGIYTKLYGGMPENLETLMKAGVIIGDDKTAMGTYSIAEREGAAFAIFTDNSGEKFDSTMLLANTQTGGKQ